MSTPPSFYALQGFDGDPVEFTWSEIHEIPYAADILDRNTREILPAPSLSGEILFEVQKLLRLKQEFNVTLVPVSPPPLCFGPVRLVSPPVSYHVPWDVAVPCWPAEFKNALAAYGLDDLLKMLRAFDFLCMYDYRTAIVHRLLWVLQNPTDASTDRMTSVLCSHSYFQSLLEGVFHEGVTAATACHSSDSE